MERMVGGPGARLIWDGVGEANQLTVLLLVKERNRRVSELSRLLGMEDSGCSL